MNNPARKSNQWTSSTDNVVSFPNSDPSSSSGTFNTFPIDDAAFSDPTLESRLKQIVEGAVFDAYVKNKLGRFSQIDDPFGSIYISELKPDEFSKTDIDILKKYTEIKDLSNTIEFSDGWDD